MVEKTDILNKAELNGKGTKKFQAANTKPSTFRVLRTSRNEENEKSTKRTQFGNAEIALFYEVKMLISGSKTEAKRSHFEPWKSHFEGAGDADGMGAFRAFSLARLE